MSDSITYVRYKDIALIIFYRFRLFNKIKAHLSQELNDSENEKG